MDDETKMKKKNNNRNSPRNDGRFIKFSANAVVVYRKYLLSLFCEFAKTTHNDLTEISFWLMLVCDIHMLNRRQKQKKNAVEMDTKYEEYKPENRFEVL